MNSEKLMEMALGLKHPWQIESVEFKAGSTQQAELHITVAFTRGSRFGYKDEKQCAVHDTQSRTWQHLNFFEHPCFLHCQVPRIKTDEGKVALVAVPWARSHSGFTLLFEAFSMALIESEMSFNKIGKLLQVYPQRIWTIFNYWIHKAYLADDPSTITQLGIDETSSRKGLNT